MWHAWRRLRCQFQASCCWQSYGRPRDMNQLPDRLVFWKETLQSHLLERDPVNTETTLTNNKMKLNVTLKNKQGRTKKRFAVSTPIKCDNTLISTQIGNSLSKVCATHLGAAVSMSWPKTFLVSATLNMHNNLHHFCRHDVRGHLLFQGLTNIVILVGLATNRSFTQSSFTECTKAQMCCPIVLSSLLFVVKISLYRRTAVRDLVFAIQARLRMMQFYKDLRSPE